MNEMLILKLIILSIFISCTVGESEKILSGTINNDNVLLKNPTKVEIPSEPFHSFNNLGSVSSHTSAITAGSKFDFDHPCLRPCTPDSEKRVCHYIFKAEWYITLSKACYDCPYNVSDCFRPHCVVADGLERPIVTVNRQFPGPSIQVCEGDELMVDLQNDITSETTSIHWHGIHQKGTPYMDGVPFLTQCPIQPHTTFRYHFLADIPGTHYWHSHSGYQRGDGMFGSLVVRSKNDPHQALYDQDDPLHVVVITDWMDRIGLDKFVNHHLTEHENKPYNILINGLGKYKALTEEGRNMSLTPLQEFRVRQGQRYRFRSISNAIQNCPIEVSVDNHTLLMIASDGQNIQPVEVDSFVIYAGERWDFVLNANQTTGVYWFKFRGLLDCDDRFFSVHQVAILRYEGADGLPFDPKEVDYKTTKRKGFQLNSLNAAPGDLSSFITTADIRNLEKEKTKTGSYNRKPDYKFWLSYDFFARDNDWFHHPEYYGFYDVVKKKRMYLPQMNNITFAMPSAPPLSQPEDVAKNSFCNASSVEKCSTSFCFCTHTLNVELGSLVEIILVDSGVVYYANHPFHLHGHVFAVLGMERLGDDTTLEAVKELERKGTLQRNFVDPPLKDSVTVPDGGYTVLRFFASNPGYWLFHCHLLFHSETGMGLVFHVGEDKHIPPVPKNYPKCGSWMPDPVSDLTSSVNDWKKKYIELNLLGGKAAEDVRYNVTKIEKSVESKQLFNNGWSISESCSNLLVMLYIALHLT